VWRVKCVLVELKLRKGCRGLTSVSYIKWRWVLVTYDRRYRAGPLRRWVQAAKRRPIYKTDAPPLLPPPPLFHLCSEYLESPHLFPHIHCLLRDSGFAPSKCFLASGRKTGMRDDNIDPEIRRAYSHAACSHRRTCSAADTHSRIKRLRLRLRG